MVVRMDELACRVDHLLADLPVNPDDVFPLHDAFPCFARRTSGTLECPRQKRNGTNASWNVHDAGASGGSHVLEKFVNSVARDIQDPEKDIPAWKRRQALSISEAHNAEERGEIRQRVDSLSPREREVMALVVSGKLNKQTGRCLGVSEKTVKAHRAQVMDKMQVDSLAELVRVAEKIGLQSPPA